MAGFECSVTRWQPRGHREADEARLDICGADLLPESDCWHELATWWLAHRSGANSPNWDIAAVCSIDNRPGLVLVEAKAHERELDWGGKRPPDSASAHSIENHKHIEGAIAEASKALNQVIPGVVLSRDSHYQLANRVAHSWKLASLGVPVVLVYLGFIGAGDIADVGRPLKDDGDWRSLMATYLDGVLPGGFVDRWISCGKARMQMVIRSRQVLG